MPKNTYLQYHMPPTNVSKGAIGLKNLGNTCYLNAAIQALRHVSDLTVFFRKHSDSWIRIGKDKNIQLCHAYKELIQGMWTGTGPGYMKPAGFLHHFRESLKECPTYEHMITPMAHDSHEALVFLLDQLHEGMKKPLLMNVEAVEGSPTYKALITWKNEVAPNYSPITDYFFGLMEVSVTCEKCKNVSCRYEPFNMLKVGFPDPKMSTVEQCIDYEFSPEKIDEYQCDTCSPDPPKGSTEVKAPRPEASIQRRIWRLPRNLILVLKRFNPNQTKCNANFSAEPTQKFTRWFSESSPESSKVATYNLQSVIDHHGSTNGGHYVSQIKSPLDGSWNVYDDESVSTIQDGSKVYLGQHSYVLFYRQE